MQTVSPDFAQLKSGMKATWMAGDFGQIANFISGEAADFVARIDLKAGNRVLDVACGTGNTAQSLPPRPGPAKVTGVGYRHQLAGASPEAGRRSSTSKSVSRKAMPSSCRMPSSRSTWF